MLVKNRRPDLPTPESNERAGRQSAHIAVQNSTVRTCRRTTNVNKSNEITSVVVETEVMSSYIPNVPGRPLLGYLV